MPPRRGADVRDVDGRGSSAARTAVRVAAVGACALAGVAAVSGDVFGHFAGAAAFRGSDDRARLGESHEGRWATAFDLADDSAFSLRDGKRGAWGAARGVSGAAPRRPPLGVRRDATRGVDPESSERPRVTRTKSLLVPEVGRAPVRVRDAGCFFDPRGRGRGRVGDPPVSRGTERVSASRAREPSRPALRRRGWGAPVDRPAIDSASSDASSDGDSDTSEPSETYEYEENYDNDGSVSWEVAYAPPRNRPRLRRRPRLEPRRRPTSRRGRGDPGKASAGTSRATRTTTAWCARGVGRQEHARVRQRRRVEAARA